MDRVLVAEKLSSEGVEALRREAEVDVLLDLAPETLLEMIGVYDALVVRSATRVGASVIQAGKRLRVIGRAGSGVDNIDLDAATRRGIMVVNAPASNSVAVAELTIALLLSLARNIPQGHRSVQEGRWERSRYQGWEVRGKTLGLMGLGRIGAEVARRAKNLEMEVVAFDPGVSQDRPQQLGVQSVSLDELLAQSDVISLHVPLMGTTRGMFNQATFARMKPGSYLINTSRGALVEEDALMAAIQSGHLAGAAVDVYLTEPPTGSRLIGHPRVITTPHLGASTREAQIMAGLDIAAGVLAGLKGATPRYAVNAPFIAPESWRILAPYIDLGLKLGSLCFELVRAPVEAYEIGYCGELAALDTVPLRLAVLQGLLQKTSEQRLTPVNTPLVARERGLRLKESSNSDTRNYAGLLVLKALTANGEHVFGATILRDEIHIVQADNFYVDFVPEGSVLFTYHLDRPGMIGRIGSLLGAADVNISNMHVGRLAPRGQAMMVLKIDEPLPAQVLEKIRAVEDIEHAVSLTFV